MIQDGFKKLIADGKAGIRTGASTAGVDFRGSAALEASNIPNFGSGEGDNNLMTSPKVSAQVKVVPSKSFELWLYKSEYAVLTKLEYSATLIMLK
jgi:hypothetical protein